MGIADRLKAAWPWAAMLVVALYLFEAAGHFAYAHRPGELGPDVWPRAVLVLLIVVCGVQLVAGLLPLRRVESGADDGDETIAPIAVTEDEGGAAEASAPRYPWLLYSGIALTILYVLGMGILGFFLATVLYLALFMLAGRYRRYGVIAATSTIGSLAFVYVFMKIVYVSLPLGTGPFQQLSVAVLAAMGVR